MQESQIDLHQVDSDPNEICRTHLEHVLFSRILLIVHRVVIIQIGYVARLVYWCDFVQSISIRKENGQLKYLD